MRLNQAYNHIGSKRLQIIAFYVFALSFILLNAWLVVEKKTMLGFLIPALIGILIIAALSYDKLIWLSIILTPLSVPLQELYYGLPFDMAIPTEPIMFGILILFSISWARGARLDSKLILHPVAIVIYFYLGWMAVTSFTSTMPVVSFKYLVVHIWYVVIFFFIMAFLFVKHSRIFNFIWAYAIPVVPVIFYTIARHIANGMHNDNAAHWVMKPFYNDHTSYGAVLSMFIPFLLSFVFAKWISKKKRFWIGILLSVFVLAEVLSYSRAAWLSLIAALGVWGIMKLKIKFKTLAITFSILVLTIFAFQDQILMKLEQNSTDSSANLTEHISSITNISTDASNVERINRWQCAIEMFKEKPVFGWGPGTYAMNYAPYQLTRQRTIISTNTGDGGNAHSEYLGPLSEQGVLGMFSFILIVIVVLYTGIKAYTRADDKRIKTLLLASVAALVTYYTHGVLNNFLDTDKAAVPFWGITAIIVALDLYTKKQKNTLPENTTA
ncbi:MAG: O-antigen ligase family protein [Prolixibacteraceae bacterium]|nr:O-antigen ligase family protein [Prolixibacteraceae bacterium]